MNEKVQQLADVLTAKAPSMIRLAFHEEDRTKDPQPEAAHFLKFNLNGDERRMGRDLELYSFMGKISGDGLMLSLMLEELVLPLRGYTDEAYNAGIEFMQDQGTVFDDEKRREWNDMLSGFVLK